MEDIEVTTHSLEESIKRVVCIEDSIQEPTAVTELMSPSKEPDATLQVDNVAADIKLIDVVNGKPQEAETVPVNVIGNSEKPEVSSPVAEEIDPSNVKEDEEESDSDSEDDLQVIVNDEDIYYPHGIEGAEDAEGEEMFVVPGDEHYEELDWAAEMHYVHSQYKYVRGQDAGAQDQTPAAKAPGMPGMPFPPGGYGMEMYYPFYEFVLPPSKTVFDIDIDQFEDKPWEYPGTDITDYFNYGLTEETWRQYCEEFAKAREASSLKSKRRQDGGYFQQGWNYDNGGYSDYSEPQYRGRGPRGMRNHMSGRDIQMEGGIYERRSTGDLRRQRLRDSAEISLQDRPDSEFRRRPRSDELQRRKGYSRYEQDNLLTGRGRLHFSQASPGGTYPSDGFSPPMSGRQGMYNSRHRMPSPGDLRNGFRRHSMDNSSYPWRRNEDQYDDEDNLRRPWRRNEQYDDDGDASYGSSGHSDYRESDKDESEDEYMRSRHHHRLRRFSTPLEKRLGARTEMEKPSVRLSRHAVEEGEDRKARPEPLKRSPQRAERSSASAQVSSQRRSSEIVTEKRSSQVVKRLGQVSESRTIQLTTEKKTERRPITERKTQREEKQTEAVEKKQVELVERRPALERRIQTVTEKQTEVVTEIRQQSISERRAHLIAERKEKQRLEKAKLEKEKAKMEKEKEKTKSNISERKEKARVDIPREKARVDVHDKAKMDVPERKQKARVDIPERTERAKVDIPERRERSRVDIMGRREKARVDIPEDQETGKVVSEKRPLKLFRDRLGGSQQQVAEKPVREKKINNEMRPVSKTESSLQRSIHVSDKKPSSRTLKLDERPKSKQQETSGKDDLRMKVLEKVSARWKLHLRMDDAHAKRKREVLNKPVQKGNDEETRAFGYEKMDIDEKDEDEYERRRQEKREERKRKHKERKDRRRIEEEDEEGDLDEYEQKGDERWQMEDADRWDYNGTEYEEDSGIERERRRKHERYEEEESEEDYNRRPHTRHEYEDDDAYEMKEEGECEEDAEEYEDDLEEDLHSRRRKRRRYTEEHYSEYEAEPAYEEETRREYTFDDSTSSGQGEEVFYKRKGRGNMYARRDSDRWTGNLDDSAEDEYEEEYE